MQYSTLEIDTQPTTTVSRRRKGSNFSTFMSKGFHLFAVLFITMITTAMSCKTPAPVSNETETVKGPINKTMATVVDYTGLDGCSKMLMLDDDRLMAVVNDQEIVQNLHYGQRVAITFDAEEPMISICMAEHLTAKIKTIDVIEEVDFKWLDGVAKASKPYNITRCNDKDGDFIYVQTGKLGSAYTMDGKEICKTPGKAMSDCVRRFSGSRKCVIKK